jgi:hypothetical protein
LEVKGDRYYDELVVCAKFTPPMSSGPHESSGRVYSGGLRLTKESARELVEKIQRCLSEIEEQRG